MDELSASQGSAAVEVLSLDQLKSEVLPHLFSEPSRIWEYGDANAGSEGLNQLSNLMESGSVSELAVRIGEIVAMLGDADPRTIAKRPSWMDKLLGREVERQARYRVARSSLEKLLRDSAFSSTRATSPSTSSAMTRSSRLPATSGCCSLILKNTCA